ncbi:LacI family DNA-binding transcriptional regulator [Aquabacter sp. L1I39]|uniref:LacI family DNA-binding transcriptional regulator n=1 Tax=Aquabacter sp. L1I39 TaxID=2820278 RepID=UPI001ADB9383|nr:LacI family DNA-binding transcriptional regulator [Aquabacter sp. L1I39]QTL02801.1 LacI family DNA-binding transcriptional regulator [Aquabacter sp. L1I39]
MDDTLHASRGKVTLQRLALELGLSTATVSLALRDSPVVAEATRQKVQEVARARGYVANRGAASLRTARTNIIGVGLHDIINPSFTELLAALEDALSAAGKTVLLGVGQEDVARQTQVLGTLAEYRPDAFIVSPAAGTGVDDLRALAATGIAVVQVTREVEGSGFDFAGSDDVTGVRLAVSHLVALGHRRIAMIGGFEAASTGRRRFAGYRAGLDAAGLPFDPALVMPGRGTREHGRFAMEQLLALSEPPTAAVSFNDLCAFGAMIGVQAAGRVVGEDVSIVGYDDIGEAALWHPALTTVYTRIPEYGRAAATLALARIADPTRPVERVVLEPHLVVRGSAGPPKPVSRRAP